jgi:hypothetical protein
MSLVYVLCLVPHVSLPTSVFIRYRTGIAPTSVLLDNSIFSLKKAEGNFSFPSDCQFGDFQNEIRCLEKWNLTLDLRHGRLHYG